MTYYFKNTATTKNFFKCTGPQSFFVQVRNNISSFYKGR